MCYFAWSFSFLRRCVQEQDATPSASVPVVSLWLTLAGSQLQEADESRKTPTLPTP